MKKNKKHVMQKIIILNVQKTKIIQTESYSYTFAYKC